MNFPDISLDSLPVEQRRLAELIGMEAYRQLVEVFGGMTIYIHKADGFERIARNNTLRQRYRDGESYRQLAASYNLSEVAVRLIVADIDKELKSKPLDGQISLL